MGKLGRLGKYELVEHLGNGATGALYLAHDPFLGRRIAIKLISREFSNPEVRETFLSEARGVGGLKHPNIVRIYDLGIEGAQVFIVMEYIAGRTLESVIRSAAPFLPSDKLRFFDQICSGLAHAHRNGWIHRDVRAANVMLDTEDGFVKLLIGSPGATTPEQIRGEPPDVRTDVFSAGTLLYELLTYAYPFGGETDRELQQAILHSEPPAPSMYVRALPSGLDAAILRAMAKSPGDRFPDIPSFHAAVAMEVPVLLERERRIFDHKTYGSVTEMLNAIQSQT